MEDFVIICLCVILNHLSSLLLTVENSQSKAIYIISCQMNSEVDCPGSSLQNIFFVLSTLNSVENSLLSKGNASTLQEIGNSIMDTLYLRLHATDKIPVDLLQAEQALTNMLRLPDKCQKMLFRSHGVRRKLTDRHGSRGPYRSYTLEEKSYVIQLHETGRSFASISKELEIPQKNVVRWCRESESKEPNKRTIDRAMEARLATWIKLSPKKDSLIHEEIRMKALELSRNPLFKASRGWLKNFIRRHGLHCMQTQ